MFIMYTSGTTAKPKGIFHTTGGYLTQAATTYYNIFDVKPETDVCWTAADIGWITGHSYIVYGPLINGVTPVMYEGLPDSGGKDRWWKIIEEYKVTILYTAPTTIRTLMKWGHQHPAGARPVEPAASRHGGRAHQPRSVDVVPRERGWQSLPHRRHVVADRDGRDHGLAACRASPPPSPARR